MKNLKKLMAVVVTVAMIVTTMFTAVAADGNQYVVEAQKLHDMGLYQGTSTTSFVPSLGAPLTREQGATMLVRIFGHQADANDLTESEANTILSVFPDAGQISDWARKPVAYAVDKDLIAGRPDGKFYPKDPLLGKDYATLILRALGYEVDAEAYDTAAAMLVDVGGLSPSMALALNDEELTRDDFVGISWSALNAEDTSGESIIAGLVEDGIVSEQMALDNGLYVEEKNQKDAVAAVEALEAAAAEDLTVEENVAAAEAALDDAVDAAAKVEDSALDARIAAAEAGITAARAALNVAADRQAAAEAAVFSLEAAAINDLSKEANLQSAELLIVNAEEKVAAVEDADVNASLSERVAAAKATIEDARAAFEASAAVDAYVAAPYDTLEEIEAAEALEAVANTAIAEIADADTKAELEDAVAAQKALVDEQKAILTPAEVESIVADTLKTVTITFTKAIDDDTVIINDADDETVTCNREIAAINVDGAVIEIELDAAINQSDETKVTLDGIEDIDGNEVAKYEETVMAEDVTKPVAESVKYVNDKKIKINFSEPVDFATGFYKTTSSENLDGVELKIDDSLSFAKFVDDGSALEVLFLNALDEGSHTVSIKGVKDYAGFKMLGTSTFSFNVYFDETAPVAESVSAAGTGQIIITFSEDIDDGAGTVTVQETGGDEVEFDSEDFTADDNELKVDLGDDELTAAALVGFTAVVEDVEDTAGNGCAKTTLNGVLGDDETAPQIDSYEVDEDTNDVIITFSEDVDVSGATVTIIDGDDEIEVTIGDPNGDYECVVETTADDPDDLDLSKANIGTYGLEIEGVVDKSIRENEMDDVSFSFVTYDLVAPNINKAYDLGDGEIELIFTEAMDPDTISNINAYFIKDGAEDDIEALIATDAEVDSIEDGNKKVILSMPDELDYNYITVIGAEDANGKELEGAGSSLDNCIELNDGYDEVDDEDLTVEVTASNKVKVSLDDFTFTNADAGDFGFCEADETEHDAGIIAAQIASDGESVELTTSRDFTADAKLKVGEDVYDVGLYIVANGVKDMNGNAIIIAKGDAIGVDDKVDASQKAPEADGDDILIDFDEDINYADKVAGNDTALATAVQIINVDDDDYELVPNVDYTATIDGGDIVIENIMDIDGDDITVQIVKADYLQDGSENGVNVRDADTLEDFDNVVE